MTDINARIARWMGWTDIQGGPFVFTGQKPDGLPEEYAYVPFYDRSLDAQVPVWEALRRAGCGIHLEVQAWGYAATVELPRIPEDIQSDFYDKPAEALTITIHAALVAMGEVEE